MSASRSSEIRLFASEDKADDAYRVLMNASITEFEMSGPQSMKFDFADLQIKDGGSYYNVTQRIAAAESQQSGDASSLTTSIANNASAIAQVQIDFASGDVALGNQITAEVSARTTAVQAVQDALDAQEAKQVDDDQDRQDALALEISNRQAAVSGEAASRATDVAGLQSQITTLIGNATPQDLQNLSAIVTAFTSADTNHNSQLASLVSRMDSVENILTQLVNATL